MEKEQEDLEKVISQWRERTELHKVYRTSAFPLMATLIALSAAAMFGFPKIVPLTQLLFIPITAAVIQQTCYYLGQLLEVRASFHMMEATLCIKQDDLNGAHAHVDEVQRNMKRAPVLFQMADTTGIIACLSFLLIGGLGFLGIYR